MIDRYKNNIDNKTLKVNRTNSLAKKSIDPRNPVLYKTAKEYGLSIGIPEYQLIDSN